jgi:hypothetical protein
LLITFISRSAGLYPSQLLCFVADSKNECLCVCERARGVFVGRCDAVWNKDNLCRETELHGKTASSLYPLNYLNNFM